MPPSCTVNEILSLVSENLKRSRDSQHIIFGGSVSCMHDLRSPEIAPMYIYQHMKFEVPSFTDSKDMIGAKFKKNEAPRRVD